MHGNFQKRQLSTLPVTAGIRQTPGRRKRCGHTASAPGCTAPPTPPSPQSPPSPGSMPGRRRGDILARRPCRPDPGWQGFPSREGLTGPAENGNSGPAAQASPREAPQAGQAGVNRKRKWAAAGTGRAGHWPSPPRTGLGWSLAPPSSRGAAPPPGRLLRD